ncbi:hypothetical protein FCIRC_13890, partial [Fusarium circinatum]
MSGLEIPAFIIGLGGLISVFEKGFEVWRVIRRADDFGNDVADWMCKLEMEFFRFQTWWTALEHIAITKRSSHSVLNVPLQSSPLQVTLDKQFGKPIIDVATSVLRLLEKMEGILQRNGVLVVMQAEPVVQFAIMASINAPPMDFTNVSYTNLPSPTSIRLLSFIKRPRQLSPPSILGEPLLECILETVDINEAPDFDLISSTWGNPDSADPGDIDEYGPMHLYPITINGKLMFLPKNIYEALKMAQK